MRLTRFAREGLVRACMAHKGVGFEAEKWSRKRLAPHAMVAAKNAPSTVESELGKNDTALPEMKMAEMLCHRVRYFTAGAVIGSKVFVNEAFTKVRERFSEKRKDGARSMKGNAASAKGVLWSMRDLKVGSDFSSPSRTFVS